MCSSDVARDCQTAKSIEFIRSRDELPWFCSSLSSFWIAWRVRDSVPAPISGCTGNQLAQILKRSISGTYVSVEPFHLFRYLDEQSFRFNTRSGKDGDRFTQALRQVTGRRVTYQALTGEAKSV